MGAIPKNLEICVSKYDKYGTIPTNFGICVSKYDRIGKIYTSNTTKMIDMHKKNYGNQ